MALPKILFIVMLMTNFILSFLFIVALVSFAKIKKADDPISHENESKGLAWFTVGLGIFWTVFCLLYLHIFTTFFN